MITFIKNIFKVEDGFNWLLLAICFIAVVLPILGIISISHSMWLEHPFFSIAFACFMLLPFGGPSFKRIKQRFKENTKYYFWFITLLTILDTPFVWLFLPGRDLQVNSLLVLGIFILLFLLNYCFVPEAFSIKDNLDIILEKYLRKKKDFK